MLPLKGEGCRKGSPQKNMNTKHYKGNVRKGLK